MFMKNDKLALIKYCKLLFAILLAAPSIGYTENKEEKILGCDGQFGVEIIGVNEDLKFLAKDVKIFQKEKSREVSDIFVVGNNFIEQVAGGGYPNLKLKLCNSSSVINTYSTKCLVQKNSRLIDEWLRLEQKGSPQRDIDTASFFEKYEKDNVAVRSVAFIYLHKVNLSLTMDDVHLDDYNFYRDKHGKIFENGDEELTGMIRKKGIKVLNSLSIDYNHWAKRDIYQYRCKLKKSKI